MKTNDIRIANEFYAAIRKNENGKWLDCTTLSSWRETCHDKAMRDNRDAGVIWANANPVVEYRRVKIELIACF